MINRHVSMKGKYRLRTILLVVNLVVLLLPLFGLIFFRLYENELVRQTEIELISQAAVLSSVYKQKIKQEQSDIESYGQKISLENTVPVDEYYTPVNPVLNLSSATVLPPRPDGILAEDNYSEIYPELTDLIKDIRKTTLSGIKVLDHNGVVIAGSELGRDFSHVLEVSEALNGNYIAKIRQRISDEPPPALASISRGTNIRLFIAYPIIENDRIWGVVYISRTPQNILKHLYEVKETVFLAFGVIFILTLMIAAFTSYTISKPIHRLIERIELFSKSKETKFVPLANPVVKEVELLSKSFAQMANSLQERSSYIRDFATHVSHELKTPLTSIQGASELLEESGDKMTAEQKKKFFSNINDNCKRLKLLVERLLELAKADNLEISSSKSSLFNVLEKLAGSYKEQNLKIIFKEVDVPELNISQEYLETVFINLFDNSRQHGADQITIMATVKEEYAHIDVLDNGQGISIKNHDKIFTPFFTTRREEGGTGIGLRIIKSLLQAHEGNIKLVSSKKGACFEVVVPLFKH